jgi:hypothetical protein
MAGSRSTLVGGSFVAMVGFSYKGFSDQGATPRSTNEGKRLLAASHER